MTQAMSYKDQLDMSRIPSHIAIIMDGNGRWAQQRGMGRSMGHQAGVETVHDITAEAQRLGIKYLTLYTFSTENWNRPADEVNTLMTLILKELVDDMFIKNNVRFDYIGDTGRLSKEIQDGLETLKASTSHMTGLTLVLAISYSSRWEITDAMRQISEEVSKGLFTPEEITEDLISSHMATRFMPDPDLLIRTGGEQRISNYLLWQIAYSELYFCDTFWPDFKEEDLHKAILDFQNRERRFGKTSAQVQNA